jgi:hypothetical protein
VKIVLINSIGLIHGQNVRETVIMSLIKGSVNFLLLKHQRRNMYDSILFFPTHACEIRPEELSLIKLVYKQCRLPQFMCRKRLFARWFFLSCQHLPTHNNLSFFSHGLWNLRNQAKQNPPKKSWFLRLSIPISVHLSIDNCRVKPIMRKVDPF